MRKTSENLQEPGPPSDPTGQEVADYIVDLLQDLRALAQGNGLEVLGILLELAEREARRDSSGLRKIQRDSEKR